MTLICILSLPGFPCGLSRPPPQVTWLPLGSDPGHFTADPPSFPSHSALTGPASPELLRGCRCRLWICICNRDASRSSGFLISVIVIRGQKPFSDDPTVPGSEIQGADPAVKAIFHLWFLSDLWELSKQNQCLWEKLGRQRPSGLPAWPSLKAGGRLLAVRGCLWRPGGRLLAVWGCLWRPGGRLLACSAVSEGRGQAVSCAGLSASPLGPAPCHWLPLSLWPQPYCSMCCQPAVLQEIGYCLKWALKWVSTF